jgi:HK97 family phage portal protein
MGLFNWLFGNEQRSLTYERGIEAGLVTERSSTNVIVNEDTALGVSAVWCAVNVISQSIGSFPLITYKQSPTGRDRDKNHAYYTLLHDAPNTEQTRNVFWETMMKNALLYGNAYAEIERTNGGDVLNLWCIHPTSVRPVRNQYAPYDLKYIATRNGGETTIDPADMIVIQGLTDDGTVGYDLLRIARDNIGFSIACDRIGQKFFANSCRIGGTLETPGKLTPEAAASLKQSWGQQYQGVNNAGKTPVLEQGLTYKQQAFNNEAGLYTETRQFQIYEVARLFNIQPTKIFDLQKATWANLETLNTDFYVSCLRPWLEKLESELDKKLGFVGTDHYCEFLVDSILRGDTSTRYANYKTGLEAGFLTIKEIREWENLPAIPEPQPVINEGAANGIANAEQPVAE